MTADRRDDRRTETTTDASSAATAEAATGTTTGEPTDPRATSRRIGPREPEGPPLVPDVSGDGEERTARRLRRIEDRLAAIEACLEDRR